jgi:hypothetical protein
LQVLTGQCPITIVQEWEEALFVIEFLPKVRLIGAEDPDELEWTPMLSPYETLTAANDAAELCSLDDSDAYVYRVREVA